MSSISLQEKIRILNQTFQAIGRLEIKADQANLIMEIRQAIANVNNALVEESKELEASVAIPQINGAVITECDVPPVAA